jgi:signal transduction histidine kinase
VLGVEFAELLELTPSGGELLLRAGAGWRDGWIGMRTVGPGCGSQAGYTLLCNAPVVVEDLAHETRFRGPPLLIEHGVVSGASVVLRARLRPYGVLGAHTTSKRAFSADDVHFLQAVADIVAATIERHQLEEELLAATGREQRRIGQDLHDGLCQHLAGVEFRTEALARDLADAPVVREEVEKIGALVRDGTRQARMLARGLAPVELERNGLMSALSELATNSAHLFRIECRFRCQQPVLVADEATGTHLYRIAQEAISNAIRHARAKTIEIALRPNADEEAVLTVTNDGMPLPEKPERGGGMGLHIMNYRAELIGGTLRLGSTADGRTQITCTFKPRR